MNRVRLLPAILLSLIILSPLRAQFPRGSAEPILEVCPCDSGSGVPYEWGLWVDRDGDGLYDHRVNRGCDSLLGYWADGAGIWGAVSSVILREVGSAPPTLRKKEMDEGTFWYVEERDSNSDVPICVSGLNEFGYAATLCDYRRNVMCYFDLSFLSQRKPLDPILDICPCEGTSGVPYTWDLWVDHDRNGEYDHRMYRGCDSVLGYWGERETFWEELANRIEIDAGDAVPTLRKGEVSSETFWYVEERDSATGAVLCRARLDSKGHPITSCKQRLNGIPCYFPDLFSKELPDRSGWKIETIEGESE